MKSILIHLTDGVQVESTAVVGLDLALRFGAKVDAVFAIPALATTFWGYEAADYLPVLQQKLEQSAQIAMDKFKQQAVGYATPISCTMVEEAYLSTLAQTSRGYDLLVTPQPKSQPDSVVEMEFQAADLVVGCACPTLVIPRRSPIGSIGNRVVIAWNDSRESSRAVRDALPLLERAQDVLILGVHTNHQQPHPTQNVEDYLTNHGIRFQTRSMVAHDHNVTETILDGAAQHHADLLVMGAWGHSRFRELVLGGVTRGILETADIPVLMSH